MLPQQWKDTYWHCSSVTLVNSGHSGCGIFVIVGCTEDVNCVVVSIVVVVVVVIVGNIVSELSI
jgi:cadmium resistance protein CadD (predicted permease)